MKNKKDIITKSSTSLLSRAPSIILFIIPFIILNASLASATLDLANPENNTKTNQQNITFEYYTSLDNVTNCSLILDSEQNITSSNITNPGFNEFEANLDTGEHTWSIACNAINSSENSEQRTLTVDTTEPTLILVSPPNNTRINSSDVEINFIVINTPAENSSCDIIINTSVNKSIIAEDSKPVITTITDLDDELYEWKVTCYDHANNSETSETRTFRVNTSTPMPVFNISIDKTEYVLGELGLMTISAPNGTSIRVEVCPDQPGFVECAVPVNAQKVMNYPFQEYVPFYTYEGKYVLEAYFNYSGTTETKVLGYEVKNNINIDIDVSKNPRKNVPVIIEAEATGGVGKLNYTWHLSNGTVVDSDTANITYSTAGDFTEKVSVKDAYNNTKNKSVEVDVSNSFYVEVAVKDSNTNAVIKDASVEIEDEQKKTDNNGKVYYYLEEGRREILILSENYSIYLDKLNITGENKFTILLEPIISTEPVVTLISPENNTGVNGPASELVFKTNHNKSLNCSVYINEDNDGFFIYLGSLEVSSSSEQIFGVIDLDNTSYWWKVECFDNKGNSGTSDTWMFRVGEAPPLATTQGSEETKTYNDWIKEFEAILDEFESLPKDEKEAAEGLGIIKKVEDSIQIFKNTIRDLDSLRFRDDLSEQEKKAEQNRIILKAEEAYQKAPINIQILNSESFVDYINNEKLGEVLEEYITIKDVELEVNKKKLLKYLEDLQQEIVISTNAKNVLLMYKDGSNQEVSVVIREIKTYNLTGEEFILEIIPKEVAQKADDIKSAQEYEVVKQDPIIKFELKGDTTLAYYFENKIKLDLLKSIKSAVFIDPASIDKDKITGFSTKKLPLHDLKGMIWIPVMVVLLGGVVFVGIKYKGLDTAKYVFYKLHGHKDLYYLKVILNDIKDALDSGDTEKALGLYGEAKGAYSELSTIAKNDVYEQVVEMSNTIRNYCQATERTESKQGVNEIKERTNNISALLTNGQLGSALKEYKEIESIYNQLDNQTKEIIHPALVALGNKIQIMIENEKDKI